MATLSRCKSRSLYSWWWDSHNSPKNSKWLQDNLTDIDAKVQSMIKLIEEDADSFARRAEMYYQKRPELMKLVEEFYRAYRALAERYSHATGELRSAHRALAKAYPDQIPPELVQYSGHDHPHTPEMKFSAYDGDDFPGDGNDLSESMSHKNAPCKEDAADKVIQLSNENHNLREKVLEESERAGKAENEVGGLRQTLDDMQSELENVLVQYQMCTSKLSLVEGQLSNAQKDLTRLNENANGAEVEVQTLKEALILLEAEKNAGLVKEMEYMEKISRLELKLSRCEETIEVLNSREIETQGEVLSLKEEIARLVLEKDKVLHQYKECARKASALEDVISDQEDVVRAFKKQAEKAEEEVSELKKSLANLTKQKEASTIQYKCCLERISKLEEDLSIGNLNQKNAEDKYNLLEISNRSLKSEAENLAKKISVKDQELSEKQKELESLQSCLQGEHLRRAQIESTFETLKNLHSQSQEDQKALGTELKDMLQRLKDLEISKHGLEEEVQRVQDEKERLCEANLSSAVSMENMQSEILSLKQIKLRFEKEVSHHVGLSDSLQQEILCLREEIKGLNTSYDALVEQVEAEGLAPECLGSAIKSLKDENSLLMKNYDQSCKENEVLSKKLENMQEVFEKKLSAERSLSDLNTELEKSQKMIHTLHESSQFLHGEKTALVAEKSSLLSQLQVMTKNMHRLLEKNAVLENSFSTAKVELEGLREKSKGLEVICEMLKNERSYLLSERERLVFQLEKVERRLESVEEQCIGLEKRYADLEKEKEAMHLQVQSLELSLSTEKQERSSSHCQSEMRMAGLERQIHYLEEEKAWKKKEFDDELEKSLKAQFELSVLEKFMKDMEEKNYSLIVECQKHVGASKLAEKLISELESESLEQQVEAELLLDEIERLRFGIHEIFRALKNDPERPTLEEKMEKEETYMHHIFGIIDDMKRSLLEHEDNEQLCLVENSVLLTLLEQLESKGKEMESHKACIEKELKNMAKKLSMVKVEKDKVLELNMNLLKKFSDLKDEKFRMDQYIDESLLEHLSAANHSAILESFINEKLAELNLLLEDLSRQRNANSGLEREMCILTEKLEVQKAQHFVVQDTIRKLENEMQGIREYTVQLKKDIQSDQDRLRLKETELLRAEMKLQASEDLNLKLGRIVDELKIDIEESAQIGETLQKNVLHLSEDNSIQKEEIEGLRMANAGLKSELDLLHVEINKKVIREQALISELQEKNSMLESWETEATAFYSDLQMSSFNEILYKKKIQELTDVCSDLEKENIAKTSEVELMKSKVGSLESQISKLKSRLHAAPVRSDIEDDTTSLKDNATPRMKLKPSQNQEPQMLDDAMDSSSTSSISDIHAEEKSLVSLQNLQTRFKAVGKMIEEMDTPLLHRKSGYVGSLESPTNEIEQLKVRRILSRDKQDHSRKKVHVSDISSPPKVQKNRTKAAMVQSGLRIKDIPLDQVTDSKRSHIGLDDEMLELWETAEDSRRELTIGESLRMSCRMSEKGIIERDQHEKTKINPESRVDSGLEKELSIDKLELSARITEPTREMNSRRILERLASDAKKLDNLQMTLDNLKMKLRACKKSKHAKNVDFETIGEQLQEAEETVLQLVILNGRLVKNTEDCPTPGGKALADRDAVKTQRRTITEQARKGSDRIGRLQLELQKIQYILLNMEDDKKITARSKFFRSKTIILRDFIYNGRKNSGKRKKGPACGCFRPSTSRNGRQG